MLFAAICIIGLLLRIAYWIYTKVENSVKKHRKVFVVILVFGYISIILREPVINALGVDNIITTIIFSVIGVFSFFLLWCLLFSLNKS